MNERDDEWLRSEVRTSVSDKRPPAPIDEVFKRVRAKIARASKVKKRGARRRRSK